MNLYRTHLLVIMEQLNIGFSIYSRAASRDSSLMMPPRPTLMKTGLCNSNNKF